MQNEKERQRRKTRNMMLLNGDAPDNVSLVNDHKSKRSTPKQSKRGQLSKTSNHTGDGLSAIAKMPQIDMSK